MQKITGKFTADGLATILNLGFVPDLFRLITDDGTNPDVITYYRQMELESTAVYGILVTGSTGAITRLTTAAAGIAAYDSFINGVMVESPQPGIGKIETPWNEYADLVTAGTTPTARTAAIVGTIVMPSTRNGYVYECTTSSGACLAEPTWPTSIGGTVTDSASNVWTCRMRETVGGGAKGVTIGASVSQNTDGNVCYFEAERVDVDSDRGDVGNYAAGQPVRKSQ